VRIASDRQLAKGIKILKGAKSVSGVIVFSIMKDEIFFVRAFFDHYRKLGVDGFLVLDDGSSDGTLEFLLAQRDTTVLTSDFAYGEEYSRRAKIPWRYQTMRAGIRLKSIIPDRFLRGQWCVYADADEFLVIPPQFNFIRDFTKELDARGMPLILGSVIEFYPHDFPDLSKSTNEPSDLPDLLSKSPFFDSVKLFNVSDKGEIIRLCRSASGRLFSTYGVPYGSSQEVATVEEVGASKNGKNLAIGSAIHKIPLIHPSRSVRLKSGHFATVQPSSIGAVAVLHFKFTFDIVRRTRLALESKAWSRGSAKYSNYQVLLSRMEEANGTFLGPDSVIYEKPQQLVDVGNIWWNVS